MRKVWFGFSSSEGDRLGHLVRGVQMLRSYGKEASAVSYSAVVDFDPGAGSRPTMLCVLECMSDATPAALLGICRETQWALGDEPQVLTVQVLKDGNAAEQGGPAVFQALMDGKMGPGMALVMPRYQFADLCAWGQQITTGDDGTIGEWPSATGR